MRAFLRASLAALVLLCSGRRPGPGRLATGAAQLAGLGAQGRGIPPLPFLCLHATRSRASRSTPPPFAAPGPSAWLLDVDARGGSFTQRWQVYAESWVALPGNLEHWPQDVRVNGAPGAVVAHDGEPSLRLAPGNYAIAGTLHLECAAGGAAVAGVHRTRRSQRRQPARRPAGTARRRGVARQASQPPSRRPRWKCRCIAWYDDEMPDLSTDAHPAQRGRRCTRRTAGRVLPEGFTPLSLTGDVPARIERDGRLRVQVRAGSHEIPLLARATRRRQRAAAPGCRRRRLAARGDLEFRGQRRTARRRGRGRRGHRSHPGQRAA